MIYQPAEDSYLLLSVLRKELPKFLRKNSSLTFLEIGAGSGIQLKAAVDAGVKKENIFSCDINSEAVKYCKNLGFNCVNSNLFEKIIGKFDLIVFNPPYLPEDKREPKNSRLSTTGGKKGGEIMTKFLKKAKIFLNKKGKIILLISSLTKSINFNNAKTKLLGKKKLFFEEIYVLQVEYE